MMDYEKFRSMIVSLYNDLGFSIEDQFLEKLPLSSLSLGLSYTFPKGSGKYRGRDVKITPRYLPFHSNFDINPSPLVTTMTSPGAFDYIGISVKMKKDIGNKKIMICPKSEGILGKLAKFFSVGFKKFSKMGYKPFDESYNILLNEQTWFRKCISQKIMDKMVELKIEPNKGALFQVSRDLASFIILPGELDKERYLKIIDILSDIAGGVEKVPVGGSGQI